jgi:hypothetical protein
MGLGAASTVGWIIAGFCVTYVLNVWPPATYACERSFFGKHPKPVVTLKKEEEARTSSDFGLPAVIDGRRSRTRSTGGWASTSQEECHGLCLDDSHRPVLSYTTDQVAHLAEEPTFRRL